MALICCAIPCEGCICKREDPCGGVHEFTRGCPMHRPADRSVVAYRGNRIHEIGGKAVENV